MASENRRRRAFMFYTNTDELSVRDPSYGLRRGASRSSVKSLSLRQIIRSEHREPLTCQLIGHAIEKPLNPCSLFAIIGCIGHGRHSEVRGSTPISQSSEAEHRADDWRSVPPMSGSVH